MTDRLMAAWGLSLVLVSAAVAETQRASDTVPKGKFRVQVVEGSFEAVFSTGLRESLLLPTSALEGAWVFSDRTLQRMKYYFPTPKPVTPRPTLSDEDVARIAKDLELRLGKEKALQFARGMQGQMAEDTPERLPCTPRVISLPHHVKYNAERSPAHIDIVEDVESALPKDGPKIDLAPRTFRGIYREEQKGMFLLCVSRPGRPRPTDFTVADNEPHVLIRLYR